MFDNAVISSGISPFLDSDSEHGYHVLGILAGDFGGPATNHGFVTGILPVAVPAIILDIESFRYYFRVEVLIADAIRAAQQSSLCKIVVNTSLGRNGHPDNIYLQYHPAQIAELWTSELRGFRPIDISRYFHATAAGNDPNISSQFNTSFAAAAQVSPLLNTAVVESNRFTAVGPGARSSFSSFDGNIAGIGGELPLPLDPGLTVFSFTGPTSQTGYKVGTSMATPQVAGLAAFLSAIAPNLTGRQILARLQANHFDGIGGPTPVVDAYSTVLSADATESVAAAPVRLAILDVTGPAGQPDGKFDLQDVLAFLSAFTSSSGALNYSRFDLNGDGRTGGFSTARFNLDMKYDANGGTDNSTPVARTVGTVTFDRQQVTDSQILCYYVHGPLYAGDPAVADAEFEQSGLQCGESNELVLSIGRGPVVLTSCGTFSSQDPLNPNATFQTCAYEANIVVTASCPLGQCSPVSVSWGSAQPCTTSFNMTTGGFTNTYNSVFPGFISYTSGTGPFTADLRREYAYDIIVRGTPNPGRAIISGTSSSCTINASERFSDGTTKSIVISGTGSTSAP
jgi:hypothetical protein